MKKKSLQVEAFKTKRFRFNDDLFGFVIDQVPRKQFKEGSILAVTSKIVSLSEGCRVSKDKISKEDLVRKESDHYLGEIGYGSYLTIKHGLMIPSAGIDESNSEGDHYITFPKNPFLSAKKLCAQIKKKFQLKNFGVLITDSHTTPLRRGVTGIALSYWGFQGVESFVGTKDLYGRALKMTHVNFADALASSAVLMMGEANESCPLAVLRCSTVKFQEKSDRSKIEIPLDQDLYRPLIVSKI
jgi:F420-0:gamma-glutamyl ligase